MDKFISNVFSGTAVSTYTLCYPDTLGRPRIACPIRIRRRYGADTHPWSIRKKENHKEIDTWVGHVFARFWDTAQPTKQFSLPRALSHSTDARRRRPTRRPLERRRSPSPATSRRPPARRSTGCNPRWVSPFPFSSSSLISSSPSPLARSRDLRPVPGSCFLL